MWHGCMFLREARDGLSTITGPRCLDWDLRYVSNFASCKQKFMYTYAPHSLRINNRRKLVTGDLGNYSFTDMEDSSWRFDLVVCTQVLEHVPHFWKAIGGLYQLVRPGGIVIFTVPFAYVFHPFPGDFWRYTPMGVLHLFESSGFAICNFVSNGYRTVQMHALGLDLGDVPSKYVEETRSEFSLLKWTQDNMLIAQRQRQPAAEQDQTAFAGCDASVPRVNFTNQVRLEDIRRATRGYWPPPDLDAGRRR